MKNALSLALLMSCGLLPAQAVITGISAGYLVDSQEAYYSTRLGREITASADYSHQLEAEIGYSDQSETISLGLSPTSGVTAKTKITSLALNYRVEFLRAGKLSYYSGAGLGVARVQFGFPGSGVPWISSHDTTFLLQAFAGINHRTTETVSFDLGLKYLWVGDTDLKGNPPAIGGELAILAGIRWKF